METNKKYNYQPDYVIHPGEYLTEVIEARGINKQTLADSLKINIAQLNNILNQQAIISSGIANQLEKVLGISANIWTSLNEQYLTEDLKEAV